MLKFPLLVLSSFLFVTINYAQADGICTTALMKPFIIEGMPAMNIVNFLKLTRPTASVDGAVYGTCQESSISSGDLACKKTCALNSTAGTYYAKYSCSSYVSDKGVIAGQLYNCSMTGLPQDNEYFCKYQPHLEINIPSGNVVAKTYYELLASNATLPRNLGPLIGSCQTEEIVGNDITCKKTCATNSVGTVYSAFTCYNIYIEGLGNITSKNMGNYSGQCSTGQTDITDGTPPPSYISTVR